MALPKVTMRQLLEAGVHFGHNTSRWNPQVRQYIFGVRGGVHIIDLQQTLPLLNRALKDIRDIVSHGGRVLFVGTKRQAQEPIAEAAKRCGQYYVNHRWLGGMMTNWNTISTSIKRLRELDESLAGDTEGFTKKEILMMTRERDKLNLTIGGIKDMGGQPDALFVIDTNKEKIAILEANKLGIPVFAIVDSNSDIRGVDYIIPGNDDALRAIDLYCDLFADAILDGLQAEIAASGGKDLGADENAGTAPKKADKKKTDEKSSDDKGDKKESEAEGDSKAKASDENIVEAPVEKKDSKEAKDSKGSKDKSDEKQEKSDNVEKAEKKAATA